MDPDERERRDRKRDDVIEFASDAVESVVDLGGAVGHGVARAAGAVGHGAARAIAAMGEGVGEAAGAVGEGLGGCAEGCAGCAAVLVVGAIPTVMLIGWGVGALLA